VLLPLVAALALSLQAPPDDWEEEAGWEEPTRHLHLTAWGGGAVLLDQSGATSPWLGAELGWRFTESSLSAMFEEHHYGREAATRTWTPVALARATQHFETQRGLDGTLTLGLGAGKPDASWIFWYQVALGVRVGGDPFFLRAELGFERDNFFRFGGGLGVAF
jgi:hypothetical protein